jgi:hypothetical protein
MKYAVAKERGIKVADRTVARGVPNRVPFGYRRNGTFVNGELTAKVEPERDGKALVPDPETAPLLRRIFEMRADGYSWSSIGRWLGGEEDEDGKPRKGEPRPLAIPPRGGTWAVSTLRNVIANEMYLGVVTLGDRRLEDAHEPLISRSLWKAAQSSQTLQRTGNNAAGLAGGILVCAYCRRRLSVTGTQNPSYTCRRQLGGKCPRPVYVSKRRTDAFVEEEILVVLRGVTVDAVATSWEIGNVRQAFAKAKQELEHYVLYAKAALDGPLFQQGLDARQADVDAAREALDDALITAEVAAELPSANGWDALDLDRKRQVARALIDSVVVYDAKDAAEKTAQDRGVESYPSTGRTANVEMRFDLRWRGDGDYPVV